MNPTERCITHRMPDCAVCPETSLSDPEWEKWVKRAALHFEAVQHRVSLALDKAAPSNDLAVRQHRADLAALLEGAGDARAARDLWCVVAKGAESQRDDLREAVATLADELLDERNPFFADRVRRLLDVAAAEALRAAHAATAAADELERQAKIVRRRVATHHVGLPHGDCRKCEAWREVAAQLEAHAAERRKEAGR